MQTPTIEQSLLFMLGVAREHAESESDFTVLLFWAYVS